MKTKIEIKSTSGKVLFECEKENNTIKDTLKEAINCRIDLREADLYKADLCRSDLREVDLRSANLCRANLSEANLYGAKLCRADLYGANLYEANLCDANLYGADLCEANLHGADLYGADLREAYLYKADLRETDLYRTALCEANLREANLGDWGKIQEQSDILVVGNIGSRNGYTTIFNTNKGVFVMCGCFKGSIAEFEKKVKEIHQGSNHERNYLAMIEFAKIKFGINEKNKADINN